MDTLNEAYERWMDSDYQKKEHSALNGNNPHQSFIDNIDRVKLVTDRSALKLYEDGKCIGEAKQIRFFDNAHVVRRFPGNRKKSIEVTAKNVLSKLAEKETLPKNTTYPIKQRIITRYTMQGLTQEECREYLRSRMKLAGCTREIFTPEATLAIYNISGGAPRVVNNIATASLMYSAMKRADSVDEESVFQANIELGA